MMVVGNTFENWSDALSADVATISIKIAAIRKSQFFIPFRRNGIQYDFPDALI